MAKNPKEWYNSDFAKLLGGGILLWGLGAGIGKILEGHNTNSPRQTIRYEMNDSYRIIEQKKLNILEKNLELYKDSLPSKEVTEILKDLAK